MKKLEQILALRVALIIASGRADKLRHVDDGGTCNLDRPLIHLDGWSVSEIEEAFKLTGLEPCITNNVVHILGGTEGQGYRRTAMAETIAETLREFGYCAGMSYRMD